MCGLVIAMYLWSTVIPPVVFEHGKATIRPSSFATLDALGAAIVARGCTSVEVHGHREYEPNQHAARDLSDLRARAVRDYFVGRAGVDGRIVVARGFGDSVPRVPRDSPDAARLNRRIEVILSGCVR
jgi:OOP family OmpA-OmpF porin